MVVLGTSRSPRTISDPGTRGGEVRDVYGVCNKRSGVSSWIINQTNFQ